MGRKLSLRGLVAPLLALTVLATTPGLALAETSPSTGALFGAYIKPETGWSESDVRAAINGFESDLGRTFDIDHHYYPFTTSFPRWKETWDLQKGRVPLISWGAVSTAEVNAGTHDALIRARADAIKALPGTVMIRWFYEQDSQGLAQQAGTPAQYIAAWRRIHGIFEQRGATNVEWVWCGTAWGFVTGKAQTYYPGDAYVDWIAADGYNWAPTKPGAAWESFETVFEDFYAWGATRPKPLMAAETGVQEGTAGRKAQWLRDTLVTLKTQMPKLKAFVYFNTISSSFQGGSFNWRVTTSSSAHQAFLEIGQDPYFLQQEPTPRFALDVTKSGNGTGRVTSSPAGIDCGSDCSGSYDEGTSVTLTAQPNASSLFTGWSGACTGIGPCTMSVGANTSVSASFETGGFSLTVTKSGSGKGRVTSDAFGIDCGDRCSQVYEAGSTVLLSPQVATGSTFIGWQGACTGTAPCAVNLSTDTSVTAVFDDLTPPAPPVVRIHGATDGIQRTLAFPVSWSSEPGATHAISVLTTDHSGVISTPTLWTTTQVAGGLYTGTAGSTHCFTAVATDGAGNASVSSAETCTVMPMTHHALTRRGTWRVRTSNAVYGGSLIQARRRGSQLSLRSVTAERVVLIATTCRRCGTVKVFSGDRLVKKIRLRSRRVRRSRTFTLLSSDQATTASLRIRVISRRRPVRIEGLAIDPS